MRRTAVCALLLGAVRGAAADPETRPSWVSLQALDALSQRARRAVERAAGARFEEEPAVRLASPEKTHGILALYVTDPVAILLAPELAEAEAARMGLPASEAPDVARADVIREFARALDTQRRSIARLRDLLPDVPSHERWGHVVRLQRELIRAAPPEPDRDPLADTRWSGHSLFVAEDALAPFGLDRFEAAWRRLERPDVRDAVDLLRAIPRPDEALVDPPTSRAQLAPDVYARRYGDSEGDSDAVLDAFRPLLADGVRPRIARVLRAALHQEARRAGVARPRDDLSGFVSGRCLFVGDGAPAWSAAVAALRWKSPRAAEAFVRLDRAAYARRDVPRRSAPAWLPASTSLYEDRPAGFVVRWASAGTAAPSQMLTYVRSVGSVTVEAVLFDGDAEQAAGFERWVEALRPAAERAAPPAPRVPGEPAPPPGPYVAFPGRNAEAWAPELELPNLGALGIRAAQDVRVVVVQVRDWAGKPVRGSSVLLTEGDVAPFNGVVFPTWHARTDVTDVSGRASFWVSNGWGNHEVSVGPPPDRDDVGPEGAGTLWRPEDCTVTLPHTFVVRGTVRDALGTPIRARVESRDQNGVAGQWEYSEPDGTFEVRLPYGPVELLARHSEAPSEDWPETGAASASPEHPRVDLVVQKPKADPPPK